jgi:Poly(R)-hydroxyalkanoic acid synthase subunit (PHA_synth_III_E)
MAEAPKDPMSLWRDMLGQWEKSVNALANQTMGSEEYSRQMNGAMSVTLKLQESMRDAMSSYLATMNMPSRAELARLDERVQSVEAKLDRLITLVERGSASPPPPAPRPPRTKKPPS